ncbi:MAG TPA: hypothetical protein VK738_01265 [Terriglobales bacterium]|nr:hypothetical protein [Terriglobales bacterium]
MLIILFRSKLTAQAGEDYQDTNAEMESLVRQNPGFIDVKSYKSEDGERLTVVWWKGQRISARVERAGTSSRSPEYRPREMVSVL